MCNEDIEAIMFVFGVIDAFRIFFVTCAVLVIFKNTRGLVDMNKKC